MRIAINGMGRIGRLLFRRLIDPPGMEIVAVNDIMDPQNLFYLIRHDSVYGHFPYPIAFDQKIISTEVRFPSTTAECTFPFTSSDTSGSSV